MRLRPTSGHFLRRMQALAKGNETMTLRIAKVSLVFAVAIFYSLVVLNNTTDYDSNFQFVRHVLMMDSTFPGNRGMWRAIHGGGWGTTFSTSIISLECLPHAPF